MTTRTYRMLAPWIGAWSLTVFTPVAAQAPAAGGDLAAVAATAQRDLDLSLEELSRLRKTIEAEKIPLAKELARLEEQLAAARREQEEAARSHDTLSLEVSNLQDALKLRREEVTYVSNLMDEFARGFEATVHVSELQRYAPVVEAAKAASQSKDVALETRLERQLELVDASLARLNDLVGGARFEGEAIDPKGLVAAGEFAMVGPVVMFAGSGSGSAGLAVPQTGSSKPAIRILDEQLTAGLSQIVRTGTGLLPFDPSRGGALKELVSRGNLVGYFKKGGPIMWPLLFVSVLALSVIFERLFFLARVQKSRDAEAVSEILSRVENGDIDGAITVGRSSQDFVARVLTYALTHREKSLSNALMRAAGLELVRFNRGISILDTVITMAPLLGLLGTVTGMMGSFGMLGGAELSAPAQITGGIAEALIATAFGLGIAVTSLIPLNFLHNRCDDARHEMEDASTHLELLMKPIFDAEIQVAVQRRRDLFHPAAAVPGGAPAGMMERRAAPREGAAVGA